MIYTTNNTLTEILTDNLKAFSVFEKYKINYCIEGGKTVKEVCKSADVNSKQVIDELKKVNSVIQNKVKVNDWSPDFLCEYIVSNHHTYIRKIFPEITSLIKESLKTEKAEKLIKDYEKMNTDFETHMQKEEKLLFPYIKKLVTTENSTSDFEIEPFGLISKPIDVLKKEHKTAIEKFSRIKNAYHKSKKVTSKHRAKKILNDLLTEFEYDFHIHLHLENNILFPKAMLLERRILKKLSKKNL